MNRPHRWTLVSICGMLMLAGCQSGDQVARQRQIPAITKLCQKVAARPKVHRYRKPQRDMRARNIRLLAAECERLIAQMHAAEPHAEALTGTEVEGATSPAAMLEMSLGDLIEAARRNDMAAMWSAHDEAAAIYTQDARDEVPQGP